MEKCVLTVLKWKINDPTSLEFIYALDQQLSLPSYLLSGVEQLLILMSLKQEFCRYLPSVKAMAALVSCMTIQRQGLPSLVNEALSLMTRSEEEVCIIEQCSKNLLYLYTTYESNVGHSNPSTCADVANKEFSHYVTGC
ncbi:hypothetical protein ROZALSC1DRAFT_29052 [Rozella allomycis CSF55]|nr:hypothetical protein ROZALSC1DRAFT_29052 [Rozella allomycis CSF55]